MILLYSILAFANPTISYGQNPLVSIGGTAYDGENKLLLTAPSAQDLIIKDLILTSYSNPRCRRNHKSELIIGSGEILGQYETSSTVYNGSHGSSTGISIQHAFSGGLRIPAGNSLYVTVSESGYYGDNCSNSTSYGVRYMISGTYMQP
jgi:hypothetical protein